MGESNYIVIEFIADKSTNTIIYMMINSTDFLICFMYLPVGLSNFFGEKQLTKAPIF